MKSTFSIVMIAIAAFIANESAANAQYHGSPGYDGYAQPAAFAQPPVAYPQIPVGPGFEGGQFGEFAGGGGVGDFMGPIDPPYPWRYWATAEAVVWWRHGAALPTLFTTAPSPTTPRQIADVPNATVLGVATTSTLFGGGQPESDPDFGGQINLGLWLDELREVGLGARGYVVAKATSEFNAFSDPTAGGPNIGRPFFNTATGQQDSFLIAFMGPNNPPVDPAVLTLNRGSVFAASENRVYGGDLYMRVNWDRAPGYSLDIIGGYMYSRIDDKLIVGHDFEDLDPTNLIPNGTRFATTDSFSCQNNFHGATMGLSAELQSGRFTARMLGKVGFGVMHQQLSAAGETLVTPPGLAPVPLPLGFFNQPGVNTGAFVRDQFCVAPEANLTGGYQVTDNLNISVGYNFIYWSRVALAGAQANVNKPAAFGSSPFAFNNSDFWLQGLTVGVNGRF